MLLTQENVKDKALLQRLALAPLAATGPLDDTLPPMIQGHNVRLARIQERIGVLLADRERLADSGQWLGVEEVVISAAWNRLRAEAWNILLALRQSLNDREQVLAHIEARLAAQRVTLVEALESAVAKAEKRLAGDRRELVRANPPRGEYHFRNLVNADPAVDAAGTNLDQIDVSITNVVNDRRRAQHDLSLVGARQREVYQTLIQ